MEAFRQAIDSRFAPVTTLAEAEKLHDFYSTIRHNIDVWHKAKNVRKRVTQV